MMGVLKTIFTLLIACLNTKLLSTMHNPMMRIKCDLGEQLVCRIHFIICWRYHCQCNPDHVDLGFGLGCLYKEFADLNFEK